MQNLAGMLFAGIYALAAVFTIFFAMEERRRQTPLIYVMMLSLLGVILWLFGLQHASGLLSEVTQLGRDVARADHWYSQRGGFQAVIVGTIPALGIVLLCFLFWLVRRDWRQYAPVVLAVVYLACFGAIQLVSLHQMDALMREQVLGIRVSTWGDMVGLVFTAFALSGLVNTYRKFRKVR